MVWTSRRIGRYNCNCSGAWGRPPSCAFKGSKYSSLLLSCDSSGLARFDDPVGLAIAPVGGLGSRQRQLVICELGSHTVRALTLPPPQPRAVRGTPASARLVTSPVLGSRMPTPASAHTSSNSATAARTMRTAGSVASLRGETPAELAAAAIGPPPSPTAMVVTLAGCAGQAGDRDGPAPPIDSTRHAVGRWMRQVCIARLLVPRRSSYHLIGATENIVV
eukprot:SAG31_NODE_3251_length_4490_cov_2.556821_6_plen_220_part_00